MQFAYPIWLAVGLMVCIILAYGFAQFQKRNQAALHRFAAGHLLEKLTESISPGRRMTKRIFIILAVGAIFVALARPQVGFHWEEVKRKGIDILMAVDTSRSMLANDVKPNRLERSKMGIMDFVSKLEGDRVGLIPFAGTAFLMCPLTLDYDAFRQSLIALDTGIIPRGGTDIASAIREAEFAFSNNANHKILVLITDGEDLEGEALAAAKTAAAKGMTIYTVGVGTLAGELIPLNKPNGGMAFLKDETGQMVKSRLDDKMLGQIAQVTGGLYKPLGRQAEGLETIYQQKLSLVPKQELTERMRKVPIDRFEWPLLFALLLLVAEFLIGDRKPSQKKASVVTTANRRPMTAGKKAMASVAALFVLAVLLIPPKANASPQGAEKAYKKGNYALAIKEYKAAAEKDPQNNQLQFNLGAAAYKTKDYKTAATALKKTLTTAELPLQNLAYYNLGNTLYRMGQGTEKSKPQDTIKKWQAAIEAYGGALNLTPKDEDAHFNQEFVKKKLEELKKKQKKHKKKNKQSKKKNKKNKNKDKNKDKDKKQTKNQDKKDNKKDNSSGSTGKDPFKKDKSRKKNQNKTDKPKLSKNQKEKKTPGKLAAKKQDPGKQNQDSPGALEPRRRKPGQMSKEEAKNLMDSLKGDEKAMPIFAKNRNQGKKQDEKKRRDW